MAEDWLILAAREGLAKLEAKRATTLPADEVRKGIGDIPMLQVALDGLAAEGATHSIHKYLGPDARPPESAQTAHGHFRGLSNLRGFPADYEPLDASGKIPVGYLPVDSSVVVAKGRGGAGGRFDHCHRMLDEWRENCQEQERYVRIAGPIREAKIMGTIVLDATSQPLSALGKDPEALASRLDYCRGLKVIEW